MIKHTLSTFEAENRLFYKHSEAQPKKVRTYKKKSVMQIENFLANISQKLFKIDFHASHVLGRSTQAGLIDALFYIWTSMFDE